MFVFTQKPNVKTKHKQHTKKTTICLQASMFTFVRIYAFKIFMQATDCHTKFVFTSTTGYVIVCWQFGGKDLAIWLKDLSNTQTHTHTQGLVCMAALIFWDKEVLHPASIQTEQQGKRT